MLKISLNDDVKERLKPALWGNAAKTVYAEIAKGKADVFVTANKNMFVVARMEGREFVVIAVAGKDLLGNRQDIINYAVANNALVIRFHTKAPQHLAKGLSGLRVVLDKKNSRVFGPDEYIYKVGIA